MHFLRLLRKASILEADLAIVAVLIARALGSEDAAGTIHVGGRTMGTKHTPPVNGNGVLLVILTAPANASEHVQILLAAAERRKCRGSVRGREAILMSPSRIADKTARRIGKPCGYRISIQALHVGERIPIAVSGECDG